MLRLCCRDDAGATSNMKENRKGYANSYNYVRRRIAILLLLFIIISVVSIFMSSIRKQSTATTNTAHTIQASHNVGVTSDKQIHKIEYGVQSTPLVMIRSSLDEELLQHFQEEHLYSCTEEELNNISELDNRVNIPVYVYEGYYHSLSTNKNVFSRNPNPMIGKDFYKPAAGPFTRAFFEAFRVVNRDIFDNLRDNLLKASLFNETKKDDVSYLLANWIGQGHHFGDLSVQIHYGRGNEEKLISGQAWHTDAVNSLLHLAVTLRGNRVLHSKRIKSTSKGNRPIRGQLPMEILEPQQPGDVYLSSSTLMRHAPQFFDSDHTTRSIAIHSRFLYTSADVNHFYSVRTADSWNKMTTVLANTLSTANIQIPSLAQVNSQLLRIQEGVVP